MVRLVLAILVAVAVIGVLAWALVGVLRLSRESNASIDRVLKRGTPVQNIAFGVLFALILYVAFFGGA